MTKTRTDVVSPEELFAKRFAVQVLRLKNGGVQVFVQSRYTGLTLWASPGLRWPLSGSGRRQLLEDAPAAYSGIDGRLLEREVRHQVREGRAPK
jgi:hypothetical protein